jgi:phytoene dehydrogenase-like protein
MNTLVIGSGVNELAAAHCLAQAGRRVLMLEGRAAHEETALDRGWIPPLLIRKLGLAARGLKIENPDPWAAAPLPGGGRLELWHDMARSVEAIRHLSPRDAARWPAFCGRMARLARMLETLYAAPPPEPLSSALGDLARLAGLALRARRLGRQGIEDGLRLLAMPVADWLDDWFECDALKGVLGAAGIMHIQRGPRSGGTAFRLLHHHLGSPAGVFRPPHSNLRRVLTELPGIEIRRGVEVARITVRAGRAVGVVLAGGEEISAAQVVCGADPRHTLLGLVDAGWLDPELVRDLRNIRCRGVVARVGLTFDRMPSFPTLVVAPSLDYLERAYDDAKYGRVSQAPHLEVERVAQTVDGRHHVTVHAQYAPYALADGQWDEQRRRALGDAAVEALSRHAPELGAAVVEGVLSPRDLAERYGFPEGQEHHAELALDQAFWMRPFPGWARYRTPIDGLYLCGPGTHPGGGIAGSAGYNAAREIIGDLKKRGGN